MYSLAIAPRGLTVGRDATDEGDIVGASDDPILLGGELIH
jgi:hypothetical protein